MIRALDRDTRPIWLGILLTLALGWMLSGCVEVGPGEWCWTGHQRSVEEINPCWIH